MPQVPQTAQDILGLVDLRGDHLQGNVDPDIDATNRGHDDFVANKIEWPGGLPVEQTLQPRSTS